MQAWNQQAQELWGLRREEAVGQHFRNLDIGLPTEALRPMIRGTLAGEIGPQKLAVKAVNRRGRTIEVRITGSPLLGHDHDPVGVLLVLEHADGARSEPGESA